MASERESGLGDASRSVPGSDAASHDSETELRASLAELNLVQQKLETALDEVRRERLRRQQAEAELRDRTSRYALIAEGAIGGIWDWDIPQGTVYYSPGWKTLRGLTNDEVGDSQDEWSSRIHPADTPRVMAAVQAHFEGQSPIFEEEYRIICKNGSYKWILDRGIAGRDADGTVVRMAGSESDITERKRAEEAQRRLAQRLCSVRDEERSRISRAIHDELGQLLTALKMELSVVEDRTAVRSRVECFRSMIELVDSGIDTVRRIASDLHPSILDDLGLKSAVEWQVSEFTRRSGIDSTTRLEEFSLDRARATTVCRVLQEALVNVYRHAGASRLWVDLTCREGTLRLSIRDDGSGIEKSPDGATQQPGLGLMSMRERAVTFDGQIDVQSAPNEGTTILLTLPLRQQDEESGEDRPEIDDYGRDIFASPVPEP